MARAAGEIGGGRGAAGVAGGAVARRGVDLAAEAARAAGENGGGRGAADVGGAAARRGGWRGVGLAAAAVVALGLGGGAAWAAPEGEPAVAGSLGAWLEALGGRPAPSRAGVSLTEVRARVDARGSEAEVEVEAVAHVLGRGWSLVPLLPVGTALLAAEVDGRAVALTAVDGGLAWLVDAPGRYAVRLRYRVAVSGRGGAGRAHVPLPGAGGQTVVAVVPGLDAAARVVPAVAQDIALEGADTVVTATLGSAGSAEVAWGREGGRAAVVAEARYAGVVGEATVAWEVALSVEVWAREPVAVPVVGAGVAVSGATVDGRPAVFDGGEGPLAVRLPGAGRYAVVVRFETPVVLGEGPTATRLWLPRPGVGAVAVRVAGDKAVTMTPAGAVTRRAAGGVTEAEAHVPAADEVVVAWSEARPEDDPRVVRANAEIFHVVEAQEGVVQLVAHVLHEVTRGRASRFAVALPGEAVVNAVVGEGVVDWRLGEVDAAGERVLTVYLDREVSGAHRFDVTYERLVAPGARAGEPVAVPLARAVGVHRQRGMVALVHSAELQMTPGASAGLGAVGENQLPPWLEEGLRAKVTHTYKYAEGEARLAVVLAPFERPRPRFDARVDLLASIADGAIAGVAGIEIVVKSGEVDALELTLPEAINVLGVTAPSLRDHRVEEGGAGAPRRLLLGFTRALTGTARIEVAWERVLAPGETGATVGEAPGAGAAPGGERGVAVPLFHIAGAALEQGTVAIEALAAVEVEAREVVRMQPIGARDLPSSLVLRTTNPILLAYRYVHADPPAALTLAVRRHADVEVQVAAIDLAAYTTLWTADGVVLTRARYTVRNRGKQFLRLTLPEGAQVWSAELAGQPVKPARGDGGRVVLVPLLNAAEPFVAELVYVVTAEPLGAAGRIGAALPVPDIVETETRWDVYLPDEVAWDEPDTRMRVVARPGEDAAAAPAEALGELARDAGAGAGGREGAAPLRIAVPARGAHLGLTQLLANQAGGPPSFEIRYAAPGAGTLGALLALFGALVLGLALVRRVAGAKLARPAVAVGLGAAGAALVAVGVFAFGASWAWPAAALGGSALLGLALAGRGRHAAPRPAEDTPTP